MRTRRSSPPSARHIISSSSLRRGSSLLVAFALFASIAAAQVDPASTRDLVVRAKQKPGGTVEGDFEGVQVDLGRYVAVLIGINEYRHTDFAPKLRTAVQDVHTLGTLLREQYGFAEVRLLLDGEADRDGIVDALHGCRTLSGDDNLLIYFAGHGYQDRESEDGYWIPVDATSRESTWLAVAEIRRYLKNIPARHTLLISDSCFSGALTRAIEVRQKRDDRFLAEVHRRNSWQVITSGGLEPVSDRGRDGLSLFAYHFIGFLDQLSAPYVTATRLHAEIQPLVANSAASLQTPTYGRIPGTFDQGGEFILARVRAPVALVEPGPALEPAPENPLAAVPPEPAAAPPVSEPAPSAERPVGYLGIGIAQAGPLIIHRVNPNSPAELAGVRIGDELLTVDARLVRDQRALQRCMSSFDAGDVMTVEVQRGGARMKLPPIRLRGDRGYLGCVFDGSMVITEVASRSPAAAAGLAVGDRLVGVADRAVSSGDDLRNLRDAFRPRQHVSLAIERDGVVLRFDDIQLEY